MGPTQRRWATRTAGALAAGAALALLLAPGAARAEAKKTRVLKLDEISVEGRIQKPMAFYILPRSNLNYQGLERNESFLPKVRKSVEQDPF